MCDNKDCNIAQLLAMMHDFDKKFDNLNAAFIAHMDAEESGVRKLTDALDALSERIEEIAEVHTAIPLDDEGKRDFTGHRHYHKSVMSKSGESKHIFTVVKEQVAKNLVIGLMMVFMLGVQTYITKTSVESAHHEQK